MTKYRWAIDAAIDEAHEGLGYSPILADIEAMLCWRHHQATVAATQREAGQLFQEYLSKTGRRTRTA
jgi:hypothetical protein